MRPVTLADLEIGLRAVCAVPEARRRQAALTLITGAETADRHRRATGRIHPVFGCGTLMSVALQGPLAPRAAEFDAESLQILSNFINVLEQHLRHHKN